MKIKNIGGFQPGHNSIIEMSGKDADIMMDFVILKLTKKMSFVDHSKKEKAYLLLYGKVELAWNGEKKVIERKSVFDDDPIILSVPSEVEVRVVGNADDSEIAIIRTSNDKKFKPEIYDQCKVETRGKGRMNEAGTRIVKTVLDFSITKKSNLMIGEDIHYPGKWAGFPSHYHEQPEIYFYKFDKDQGFGLVKLGNEGVLVENNDTIKIYPNIEHPQVAAPGYAMYFLWVIRHLDGNPYLKPTYVKEHLWVEEERALIWPEKNKTI